MSVKAPQYVRKVDANGKLMKPINDAYVAVVRKQYNPDSGGISGKTWFYPAESSVVEMLEVGLLITQKVHGREQHVLIPYAEVLRVDFNDASQAYREDLRQWTADTTGMSLEEFDEMQRRGLHERVRGMVAKKMGIDPDNVDILGNFSLGDDDDSSD